MDAHPERAQEPGGRAGPLRMNGLLLLVLLVGGGMGITSVYYHWKAPDIIARSKAERAAAPQSGEPRVERWLVFGRSLIHARMEQLRVAPDLPWLVTHEVLSSDPEQPPELWGVDLHELRPDWVQREGMDVVVELPPAGRLGRAFLRGDKAANVPKVRAGDPPPDAAASAARARYVTEWALERIVRALPEDIEGARLVVRVGEQGASAERPAGEGAPR